VLTYDSIITLPAGDGAGLIRWNKMSRSRRITSEADAIVRLQASASSYEGPRSSAPKENPGQVRSAVAQGLWSVSLGMHTGNCST